MYSGKQERGKGGGQTNLEADVLEAEWYPSCITTSHGRRRGYLYLLVQVLSCQYVAAVGIDVKGCTYSPCLDGEPKRAGASPTRTPRASVPFQVGSFLCEFPHSGSRQPGTDTATGHQICGRARALENAASALGSLQMGRGAASNQTRS